MTYTEVLTEIKKLSLAERVLLMETLAHWMSEELAQAGLLEKRPRRLREIPPASALRGIGKPAHGSTPTDDEIREEYTNYLVKKYS
jgi:hypothetical protein